MSAKRTLLALSLSMPACSLYLPGDTGDEDGNTGADDNLYIAVGDQGALLSSPDGATWTTRTSGTSVALNDITHGDGRYVAVGQAGKILVSEDGVLWDPADSPSSRDLFAVVHHIDRFYAVGGDYSAGARLQVDGRHHLDPPGDPPARPPARRPRLRRQPAGRKIGTSQSDLQIFGLFTGRQDAGWQQRVDGTGLGLRYNAVAAGAPTFVTIGPGGSASSTDALTWTQAPILESATMRDLTYSQQGWIAVGDAGKVLASATAPSGSPTTAATPASSSASPPAAACTSPSAPTGRSSSSDGPLWLPQTSPLAVDLRAVTHPRS